MNRIIEHATLESASDRSELERYPPVSVVIRNYNGKQFVERCLNSVLNSDYSNLEVIFVDNASKDGSLEIVREAFGGYRNLTIVTNNDNLGIAEANNVGARVASGKYVVFLDNDTEVDPRWLNELIKVIETNRTVGAIQSKLLRLDDPDVINCAGVFIDHLGLPHVRGIDEKERGQYDSIDEIFCAAGNVIMIRKNLLNWLGGFDPSFFVHLEDDDLSWRVWLSGHRVVYCPTSVILHVGSGTLSRISQETKTFYLWRNAISMITKNYELPNLIKWLPVNLVFNVMSAIYHTLRNDFNGVRAYLRAIGSVLCDVRHLYAKRLRIQHLVRQVKDRDIERLFVRRLLFII